MSQETCPKCYHPILFHTLEDGKYRCRHTEYHNEKCYCKYHPPRKLELDEFGKKLQQVKVAICHKNCADGITSAVFLKDALPWVEIRFIQYGTKEREELEPEPGMLFCDFSPSESTYKKFVEAGALILDHHKKAEGVVKAFGDNGVFGDEQLDPGVCGAFLAYREVWRRFKVNASPEACEWAGSMARLAGIRDTWQRHSPRWEEACSLAEVMSFYPVETWLTKKDPFEDKAWWEDRLEIGGILRQRIAASVTKALEGSLRFSTHKGTVAVMFPDPRLSSDASDRTKDVDLVLGFGFAEVDDGFASLIYSTRTRAEFDCGAFCKTFGGGGHTQAAGFNVKFPVDRGAADPYTIFRRLLDEYESGEVHYDVIMKDSAGDYKVYSGYDPDNLSVRFSTKSLETARTFPASTRVRVGVEALGLDKEGNPKYPNAIEVWV